MATDSAGPIPRVLIVAGSDSGGGAGLQADLKTVTMLGGYAATAVTALTAQDTVGVKRVLPVPPDFVAQQMTVVLEDLGADVIKTGMLGSLQVVRVVADVLRRFAGSIPIVVDPVMVATGGQPLIDEAAVRGVAVELLPLAALVTPNIPEATALSGVEIETETDMARAADLILAQGASAVLIKGGHLPGDEVVDLLRTADGDEHWFRHPRVQTKSTHGTGCTLASAIAAGVAEGQTLQSAVTRAREYLVGALRGAPGLGRGHGPMDHGHLLRSGGST